MPSVPRLLGRPVAALRRVLGRRPLSASATLRIVSINDCYELDNLPKLRTLVREHAPRCGRLRDLPAVLDVHGEGADEGADEGDGAAPPSRVIVTICGDFLSPSLLSSLDRGRGMVDCLGGLADDGAVFACFGNHEADLPLAAVQRRVAEFAGCWLNTNMPEFPRNKVDPKEDAVEPR